MKVLITGGCGFLGSNLAASYLQDGSEVIVIDALFRTGSSANLTWLQKQANPDRFHFIQADLADVSAVFAAFRRHAPFDYICHVGGQVAMTTSLQDPARDMHTNVLGTFNVLEAIRLTSPHSLIAYSSTNKVYGDLESLRYEETPTRYQLPDYPDGLDETLSLDFSTPYGCSKGAADQYVRDWARVYGLKTVVFRHSSIFGGRQYASFDQGWVGWFCQKALEQKSQIKSGNPIQPFTIAGSGKQVRDVLHSDDLIHLYRAAYVNRNILNGEIFNIGGGVANSLSLLELFNTLSELLDIPPLVFQSLARRASDQDFFVADIRKVQAVLGWVPHISCREGITRMLDWTDHCFSITQTESQ
jgi:CDP-paratose 2-epimerase